MVDVDYKELKAKVELVLPLQCETRGCELTEEAMKALLEATMHKVPLQELLVLYEESGDFDQTALALEHLRFATFSQWKRYTISYCEWQKAQLGLVVYCQNNPILVWGRRLNAYSVFIFPPS